MNLLVCADVLWFMKGLRSSFAMTSTAKSIDNENIKYFKNTSSYTGEIDWGHTSWRKSQRMAVVVDLCGGEYKEAENDERPPLCLNNYLSLLLLYRAKFMALLSGSQMPNSKTNACMCPFKIARSRPLKRRYFTALWRAHMWVIKRFISDVCASHESKNINSTFITPWAHLLFTHSRAILNVHRSEKKEKKSEASDNYKHQQPSSISFFSLCVRVWEREMWEAHQWQQRRPTHDGPSKSFLFI